MNTEELERIAQTRGLNITEHFDKVNRADRRYMKDE